MKPSEMRMALTEVRSLVGAARESVNESGEVSEQAIEECIRLLQKVLRSSRANGAARNAAEAVLKAGGAS